MSLVLFAGLSLSPGGYVWPQASSCQAVRLGTAGSPRCPIYGRFQRASGGEEAMQQHAVIKVREDEELQDGLVCQ